MNESAQSTPAPRYDRGMAAATSRRRAPPPTPIEPGSQDLQLRVQVGASSWVGRYAT